MNILYIVIALVAAYLIGGFPSAYIVGRIRKGVDIRTVGSHNLGAMNVFYKVGFWDGMVVLTMDILKGAAGVAVARWLGVDLIWQFVAGAFVILGHNFPVFLKFRGGKGGAACIGILVFFMPWGVPIYAAIFLLLMWRLRTPTIAYSITFLCLPFVGWLIYHRWEFVVYSLVLPLLPLLRYIPRLIEMRRSGGSWKHVLYRKNLKDRL
ncbi:MAG: glycerol-3-phosphate acyltransferase [Dehalococcoidales bacterium]